MLTKAKLQTPPTPNEKLRLRGVKSTEPPPGEPVNTFYIGWSGNCITDLRLREKSEGRNEIYNDNILLRTVSVTEGGLRRVGEGQKLCWEVDARKQSPSQVLPLEFLYFLFPVLF